MTYPYVVECQHCGRSHGTAVEALQCHENAYRCWPWWRRALWAIRGEIETRWWDFRADLHVIARGLPKPGDPL